MGLYWGYVGIMKEHGNYYNGLHRDRCKDSFQSLLARGKSSAECLRIR